MFDGDFPRVQNELQHSDEEREGAARDEDHEHAPDVVQPQLVGGGLSGGGLLLQTNEGQSITLHELNLGETKSSATSPLTVCPSRKKA